MRRCTIHRLIKASEIKAHKKTLAPHSAYRIDAESVASYDERRRAPVR